MTANTSFRENNARCRWGQWMHHWKTKGGTVNAAQEKWRRQKKWRKWEKERSVNASPLKLMDNQSFHHRLDTAEPQKHHITFCSHVCFTCTLIHMLFNCFCPIPNSKDDWQSFSFVWLWTGNLSWLRPQEPDTQVQTARFYTQEL